MKRPRLLVLTPCLAAAGFLAFFSFAMLTAPQNPEAWIRVVTPAGKPIPDAVVRPYALRPKLGGGDYFWSDRRTVKPDPVTTDVNGIARLPFPRYIVEKLETGEISFTVNHPDYYSDHFSRVVAFAPPENAPIWKRLLHPLLVVVRRAPARPDPVTLKPGSVLRVSGFLDSPRHHLTNLHPQVTSIALPENEFWRNDGSGWLVTRRLRAGTNALRLAWFQDRNHIWFSDTVVFQAASNQTNEFELKLAPGLRLEGKLSDATPRPIRNGRVQLHSMPATGAANGEMLHWESTRKINPDGTFVFECIPPGNVEVIAICDGFISANGTGWVGGNIRTPQAFSLEGTNALITLGMEPAGACEIIVLDDQDRPLPGAEVSFWPNISWEGGHTSTIFARDSYNWEDVLPSGQRPDWSKLLKPANRAFAGRTDSNGVALVINLPGVQRQVHFSAEHTEFEMPINRSLGGDASRDDVIMIQSGVTNHATVRMEKKGTEFLRPGP